MTHVELRAASVSDIPLLTALANKIWHQHYPAIISLEQIDYMLGKMYNAESLLDQIAQQKHQFKLIYINDNAEGFISVHEVTPSNWFINKYYLNQDLAGSGLGTKCFDLLLSQLSPSTIRLTVNRQNFKSINFYFKIGFIIEKVADFDIGNGFVMNDFVMLWRQIKQQMR